MQSKGMQDRWDALYNDVQLGGGTNHEIKTVYFGEKPTTMNVWAQPIRGIPPGATEEQPLVRFRCVRARSSVFTSALSLRDFRVIRSDNVQGRSLGT